MVIPQGVYGKKTLPFNDGSVFPVALSNSNCAIVNIQQPQLSSGVGVGVGVGVSDAGGGVVVGVGVAVGHDGHSPFEQSVIGVHVVISLTI